MSVEKILTYTHAHRYALIHDVKKQKNTQIIYIFSSEEELHNFQQKYPEFLFLDTFLKYKEVKQKKEKKQTCFFLEFPVFFQKASRVHIALCEDQEKMTRPLSEYIRKISKEDGLTCVLDNLLYLSCIHKIFALSSYSFNIYKSDSKEKQHLLCIPKLSKQEKQKFTDEKHLFESIFTARNLVNMPPSDCFPENMVKIIQSYSWKNTKIHILSKKELEKKGFGLLLGVSQGSQKDPYVIVFERINPKVKKTYAFLGKGVTFDAGGIQIKPESMMFEMKMDMAGAANVFGIMRYFDAQDMLPYNLVGIIGLTENMTGGNAYKPSDILTAHNGKTVEITHTDAEGRLVLADLASYACEQYKPTTCISIATLTGAALFALGYNYAAILGDDEKLIQNVIRESEQGDEKWCYIPIDESMEEATKGDLADYNNLSRETYAGIGMGGMFIKNFVHNAKFVHADIAGPAYRPKDFSIFPKEGTGFGILTFVNIFKN